MKAWLSVALAFALVTALWIAGVDVDDLELPEW